MNNEPQHPESLYASAVNAIARDGRASTSHIQRLLGIGYVKASRLIERMEAEGIVSASDHVGSRQVHIKQDETLDSWRAKRQKAAPATPNGGNSMDEPTTQKQAVAPGKNMVSGDEVRAFVERIERIDADIGQHKDARKEVFAEAKARGYGTKYISALVDLRKKKPSEREEDAAMMELYGAAIGMSNELPLFRHVQGMGVDVTSKEAVIEALKLLAPMDGELTIKVGASGRMRITRNKDGVTVEEVDESPSPFAPFDPFNTAAAQKKKAGSEAPDVDEDGAFALGREARKEDIAVIANPFAWDDARRRRWDEGWRDYDGGDGMGPS